MDGFVGCRFCNVVQCLVSLDWAVRFLASLCLRTSPQLKNIAFVGRPLFRSMRRVAYLSTPIPSQGLGGWVISLHLHGSKSPRECPWHVQHSARQRASVGDLSLRWEEPIVRLPAVMGLCV